MMKHLLGQAIYQLTMLMIFVFSGDKWIPEYYPDEESTSVPGTSKFYSASGHVRSGRAYMIGSSDEDYLRYQDVIIVLFKLLSFIRKLAPLDITVSSSTSSFCAKLLTSLT